MISNKGAKKNWKICVASSPETKSGDNNARTMSCQSQMPCINTYPKLQKVI